MSVEPATGWRRPSPSTRPSLARRHSLDLDDVLVRAADLFIDDAGFAERMHWRYRHLSVDEFQDVNPAQFRLIRALLGGRDDLCAVGDPNQAIYGWNGADPSLLARLPELIAGMEVVRLDENHRSTPQVVAAATAALGRTAHRPPRSVAAGRPDARGDRLRRRRRRGRGRGGVAPRSTVGGRHVVVGPGRPGPDPRPAGTVGRALARAGIPHRMAPGPESPAGDTVSSGAGTAGGDRRAGAGGNRSGGDGRSGARDDAVELATFHRAKGLEWESVRVVGLEEGFVPIVYAESSEARDEERRLLYVALTRASRELHCSWVAVAARWANGRQMDRQPSPWLAAVARVSRAGPDGPAGTPADDRRDPGRPGPLTAGATGRATGWLGRPARVTRQVSRARCR